MTFVGDTVSGFLAAGATPGIEGETINLGTGQTFPVSHFAERILSLMNVRKQIVQDPKRIRPAMSEVLRLVSNNGKAQQLLQWTPGTSIDEGLKLTINFVEANIGSYRANLYNI